MKVEQMLVNKSVSLTFDLLLLKFWLFYKGLPLSLIT